MPDPSASPTHSPSRVIELVVNVDDCTGESLGDAQQRLLEAGALDVWTVAIGMKKNRPGIMLSVLARSEDREPLAKLMLEVTGSFGVRYRTWDRLVLDRAFVESDTRLGPVTLKVGRLEGQLVSVKPEFDSVKRLAESAEACLAEATSAAAAAADRYRDQSDANDGGAG